MARPTRFECKLFEFLDAIQRALNQIACALLHQHPPKDRIPKSFKLRLGAATKEGEGP